MSRGTIGIGGALLLSLGMVAPLFMSALGSPASAQERVGSPSEEIRTAETSIQSARGQQLCEDRIRRTDRALRNLRAAIEASHAVPRRTRALVNEREGLDDCVYSATGGGGRPSGAPSPSSTVVITHSPSSGTGGTGSAGSTGSAGGAGGTAGTGDRTSVTVGAARPATATARPAEEPSRSLLRETWAPESEGRVLEELRRHEPQILGCVETNRGAEGDLPHRVTLQFRVGARGELRELHLMERVPEAFSNCLMVQARSWRIPEPGDAISVRFRYLIRTGPSTTAAP